VNEDRAIEAGLRLELREQPVDVVDVPRPLDLRDHDHLELVADLRDEGEEVVEHPRALERVDPRPQRRVAEIHLLRDLDETVAGRLLAVRRDRVLEVAEQDVGLLDHVRDLGDHLLVRGVEEMDHPRRLDGDLHERLRRVDCERVAEEAWVSQVFGLLGSRCWRPKS
jgi:hypothetical protein